MTRAVRIAPSILAADFARLGEQVQEAEAAGADVIHVDVMDGRFVPQITMGPLIVEALGRVTRLPINAHLMIERPERQVEAFVEAGAATVIVHVEASPHLHRAVQEIKALGVRAGVSLNPGTSVGTLHDILPDVDHVLIMSVNPGWGGQEFIHRSLERLRVVREMLDGIDSEATLEVDGGINEKTAGAVVSAGADMLVAGSAVFNGRESVGAAIARLRAAIEAG